MKTIETTLVFCVRDDQILLAMKKRGFGAGRWNGAGGKLEPDETPEAAMIRECQEEIGITPTAYKLAAVHDFILDADTDHPWHQPNYAYLCTEWQGEPAETEEMRPQWFRQSDIPYETMWPDDIDWLPLVLEGKLLRTTFTFSAEQSLLEQHIQEVSAL